jgi:predicted GNAT family acetyltransferase
VPEAAVLARMLLAAHVKVLGGKGSGNFGHAGRPGQVGGSADNLDSASGVPTKKATVIRKFDLQQIPPEDTHRFLINPKTEEIILSSISRSWDQGHDGDYAEAKGKARDFDSYYHGYLYGPDPKFARPFGQVTISTRAVVKGDDEEDRRVKDSDNLAKLLQILKRRGGMHDNTLVEIDGIWPPKKAKAQMKSLGGPGSGNFGHAGRPGEVGGSASTIIDIVFRSSATTKLADMLDRFDMTEKHLRNAITSMTRGFPGKWEILVTPMGRNEISIDGVGSFPDDDEHQGTFSRSFILEDDGHGLSVDHSSFILPESLQGQGHAKLMMRNALETYERMGVTYVTTQAVDVGAYAWARAGFLPQRPQEVTKSIRARLTKLEDSGALKSDEFSRLWALTEGSRSLWRIADDPKGRTLLRGLSYDASLNLKDAASLRRARHYAGLES